MLLKIAPIWQRWSASHLNNLESNHSELSSALIDISDGALKISCSQPTEASQIKHQQVSLIETMHAAGFSDIKRIKVSMSLQLPSQPSLSKQPSKSVNELHKRITPNKNSIESIKLCGQTTNNTQLSESLNRLANTLNKNSQGS